MALYTTAVQQLYVAYFNRPADPGGLQFWENSIAAGQGSIADISALFGKSAEYLTTYAGMTNAQIVNQVYMNLFGRGAEKGGLDFWTPLLDKHQITIDNVVTQVAKGAQGTDTVAYDSKVKAATAFTGGLISVEQAQSYSGDAALGLAKGYIQSVFDVGSYNKAIDKFNLSQTLNKLSAAYTLNAHTVVLTDGIDDFVPSSTSPLVGNDIFNATSSSFNSADHIDGGAGIDTLNVKVATGSAYVAPASVSLANVEVIKITDNNTVDVNATGWQGVVKLSVASSGGESVTADASTLIVANDNNLGSNTISIHGGAAVFVGSSKTTTGSILLGAATPVSGAVSIRSTIVGGVEAGGIIVNGGTNIAIIQSHGTGGESTKNGLVAINGTAATVDVNVADSNAISGVFNGEFGFNGGFNNAVLINGAHSGGNNGTADGVKTVTVVGASGLTINSDALTTLDLRSSVGDIHLTGNQNALAINFHDAYGDTLTVPTALQTLNLNIDFYHSSLKNIVGNAVTALNISGGSGITVDQINLPSLKTLTISGAASVLTPLDKLSLELVDISAHLEFDHEVAYQLDAAKANFLGSAFGDTLTLVDTAISKNIALGAGDDHVTLKGGTLALGGHLDGGAGFDTLSATIGAAAKLLANPALANAVIGFEQWQLNNADGKGDNQTLDMAMLAGVHTLSVSGGKGLTLNNWTSDKTLILEGDGTSYTVQNSTFASNHNDVLNLVLNPFQGVTHQYATTGITASGVETINVSNSSNTSQNLGKASLALLGNSAKTIVLAGDIGQLTLTASDTALTFLDASKEHGGLIFTAGALTEKATIIGGNSIYSQYYQDVNTIDLRFAKQGVTYIGTSSGRDAITVGEGSNTIAVGGTHNGGIDHVTFASPGSSLSAFTTITDPNDHVALQFVPFGFSTFNTNKISLAAGGSLQTYADAAVHQGGNASINGAFGWFQLNGDTYLVENRHDGSAANAIFIDGTDMLVKLNGVVDLSQAAFANGSFSF